MTDDGSKELAKAIIDRQVRRWDEAIAGWSSDPNSDLGAPELLEACRRPHELQRTAMPEPYVGDPYASNLAAMLNLNPGGMEREQVPQGSLYESVRSSSYSWEVSAWKVAPATIKWWKARERWVARLLGREPNAARPVDLFGLDIFPWHSESWGGLRWTDGSRTWVVDNVLAFASAASRRTVLGQESIAAGNSPVVLGVGKAVHEIMQIIGARCIATRSGGEGWPEREPGRPVNRDFALHEHSFKAESGERLRYRVLVSWAPGSNRPPGRQFDHIIRDILAIESRPRA
ncbi:MAG: hypothetical protein AAF449_05060 [Myxococcota bacterium]